MILWQQNNITGSFSTDYTAILVFQQAQLVNAARLVGVIALLFNVKTV